jgi:hypothetical protein
MKGTKCLSFTVSYKYCFLWGNNSTLKVTSMKNCNLKMTHPVLFHNQTKSCRVFNKNSSDRQSYNFLIFNNCRLFKYIFVNTVGNILVPQSATNFLITYRTLSFTKLLCSRQLFDGK